MRKKFLHYDPALDFYTRAQSSALHAEWNRAIERLAVAFRWDKSYVERAENDEIFSTIRGYERYKALIKKYKTRITPSAQ